MLVEEAKDNGPEDDLTFLPHGRAFAIHKPNKFFEIIMPQYFNTLVLASPPSSAKSIGMGFVGSQKARQGWLLFHQKSFLKVQKELVEEI